MRKRWVVISIVFFAIMTASCGKKEEAVIEKPTTIQGVKIETIKSSPVTEEYEAVGTVHSKTTTVLSSKTMGNILAVHFREGDRVRTGQLLIEIDDRDTRAQLQKAQAGLREVQDALDEIDQNIRAAESSRNAAEAGKSLALATFSRFKALLEQKSVSPQEFDEVQAKLKVAEAELDRAERMLQALQARKGQILAKMDQVKADITSAQVYVGYSRILAPMNGIVVSKQAEVGLLAAPGVPLLTLEDGSRYRLEVSAEESMLKRVRLGTPVRVSIDALGSQEFSSRVSEIVPASDPASRSYTVKIDLFDEKGRPVDQPALRSGLFGRARFVVGQKQALKIPRKAILQRGQLVSVFMVDESNILHLRLIKTGKQYEDQAEVLSGLNDGERIVIEGLEKVKEGDRVE
ncbi:MAG TPA: efflux RND transporter periplasmic adaptor subunit [Thermodesulfobacteriota bacterium]|nr:efflux RND transporter periplasmic adaptor subunit [Thermodesulfobacteriota bacterium]